MVVSAVEILGTIPLAIFYMVHSSKSDVTRWRGWAYTHEDYSAVYQIPASIWKNNSDSVFDLEMYRWSLVLCAFLFFALFGFAEEARQNYRHMYASVVSRIGYATSTLHGSSHEYVVHSVYGSIATHGCSPFQYIICPLRKEQQWYRCHCRQDGWREARFEHLTLGPEFGPVHFHRQQQ
jgi:hypothetical protein